MASQGTRTVVGAEGGAVARRVEEKRGHSRPVSGNKCDPFLNETGEINRIEIEVEKKEGRTKRRLN